MPPSLIFDFDVSHLEKAVMTQEQVYDLLPHRHHFMLIDRVCHLDTAAPHIVVHHRVRADAWWVPGHVPGRPLLPGVLMLEMAAQAAAVLAKIADPSYGFIAYGGVEECRFREPVIPPADLHILARGREARSRRIVCDTQGLVEGRVVFEARVTGLVMR